MMNNHRRRKKRLSYDTKTVELLRGRNGYGFTISGQSPCILSCIVEGSPAEKAGLRAGDFLVSVNGLSVSKAPHDNVVSLIGHSTGILQLEIAENYYSDSSDSEFVNSTRIRPKHSNRSKQRQQQQSNVGRAEKVVRDLQTGILFVDHMSTNTTEAAEKTTKSSKDLLELVYTQRQKLGSTSRAVKTKTPTKSFDSYSPKYKRVARRKELYEKSLSCESIGATNNNSNVIHSIFSEQDFNHILYPRDHPKLFPENNQQVILKVIVGYLGTIEMPKGSEVHFSRQTIRSCIKRLQVEKKVHTLVLFTVFSDAVWLTNSSGIILAQFALTKIKCCGIYSDDKKFFGLVIKHGENSNELPEESQDETSGNSCHVFMVDTKLVPHHQHAKYSKIFHLPCTKDPNAHMCIQFPISAEVIVQSITRLYHNKDNIENIFPVEEAHANRSPPLSSNSSNSDSGIGFRDEGNDRVFGLDLDPYHQTNSLDRQLVGRSPADRLTVRAMPDPQRLLRSSAAHSHPVGMASGDRRHSMPPPSRRDVPSAAAAAATITGPPDSDDSQVQQTLDVTKNWTRGSSLKRSCGRKRSLRLNLDAGTVSDGELAVNPPSAPNTSYLALDNSPLSGRKSPLRRSSELPTEIGKVASWATGFERLLSDKDGLQVFTEFLEKEFSQENIMFWMACEEYRKLTNEVKRKEKAQDIFENHLAGGAQEPVNVDSHARLLAQGGLHEPSAHLFDQAQAQIFNLMKFDCYQRFLKSDMFKDCLVKEMHGEKVFGAETSDEKPQLKVDDKKRKSLIPWHISVSKTSSAPRSDYSKGGKVQSRSDSRKSFKKKKGKDKENKDKLVEDSGSELASSHSSITSAELMVPRSKVSRESISSYEGLPYGSSLCRVVLPDSSTTVVKSQEGDSLTCLLQRLLKKRNLKYPSIWAFADDNEDKELDMSQDIYSLGCREIRVEQRCLICVHLPELNKMIVVQSFPRYNIREALAGAAALYKLNLNQMEIQTQNNGSLPLTTSVQKLDGQRVALISQDALEYAALDYLLMPDPLTSHKFEQIISGKFKGQFNEYNILELEAQSFKKKRGSLPRCNSLELDNTSTSVSHEAVRLPLSRSGSKGSNLWSHEEEPQWGRQPNGHNDKKTQFFGSDTIFPRAPLEDSFISSSLGRLSFNGGPPGSRSTQHSTPRPTQPIKSDSTHESRLSPPPLDTRRSSEPPPIPPKAQTRGPPPRPPNRSFLPRGYEKQHGTGGNTSSDLNVSFV